MSITPSERGISLAPEVTRLPEFQEAKEILIGVVEPVLSGAEAFFPEEVDIFAPSNDFKEWLDGEDYSSYLGEQSVRFSTPVRVEAFFALLDHLGCNLSQGQDREISGIWNWHNDRSFVTEFPTRHPNIVVMREDFWGARDDGEDLDSVPVELFHWYIVNKAKVNRVGQLVEAIATRLRGFTGKEPSSIQP